MSFRTAGALGFREACAQAGPVLLEPISLLEVTVPTSLQGDVLGDLNGRRGRVQGTEQQGDGASSVRALVPTAELGRYAIDLRSITGGRGRFTVSHDHYDPVPAPLAEKLRRETHANG
jgi:elongation factor G